MGERTIPEPSSDEIEMAKMSFNFAIEQAGLDPEDERVQKFLALCVPVKAQLFAQCRWLQGIVHEKTINTD